MMERRQLMFDGAMKIFPGQLMKLADFERKVGIVHEHVYGAEGFLRCAHHRLDLLVPRHVRLKYHAAPARALDLPKDLLRGLAILVVIDNNRGTGLRQPLGGGSADTAARSGDENDFAVKRAGCCLLSHRTASPLDGDGVFRRALFEFGGVAFHGEKFHLDVR